MMHRTIIRRSYSYHRRLILVAATVAAIAGCSTAPPQVNNMVPAAQAVSMAPSSRTIRVVARAETGQGATAPAESGVLTFTSGAFEPADWARVTDAMFRDALTSTLAQSGLFQERRRQRR
jgi:curli biogenesis system outer membrane secretion channel CsgG